MKTQTIKEVCRELHAEGYYDANEYTIHDALGGHVDGPVLSDAAWKSHQFAVSAQFDPAVRRPGRVGGPAAAGSSRAGGP